jgi:hypothetical protein
LGKGARDVEQLWDRLVTALSTTAEDSRRPDVLVGFLHEVRAKNPVLAARLLDDAVEHPTLAEYYPYLQGASDIEQGDLARLQRSLKVGKAPVRTYVHLAYRTSDPIPAADLRDLVLQIAAMESGFDVAIEILSARLHGAERRKEEIAPELAAAGRALLRELCFTKKNDHEDYRLGLIATSCLSGEEGATVVRAVCRRFKEAVRKYETNAFYHDDLLQGLFSVHPLVALESLCGGSAGELAAGVRILDDVRSRKYVIGVIGEEDLLHWCDADAHHRYPALARIITITTGGGDAGPLQWSPLARHFLERAPDKVAVVKHFVSQFVPGAWSGSLVGILEAHAVLLGDLKAYPELAGFVAEETARLHAEIEAQRQSEIARDKRRDERFE